ncbi:MAG TPA: tRNA preQ1(34) S-adenosylmethionine ribosyltransferase-isomerase QueA [Nitrospirota bacterium]
MISPVTDRLKLSDFDYDLPESLIAQEPAPLRDQSRLMIMKRGSGCVEHLVFADIDRYLLRGDLLVLNDTKVFPCRLLAKKRGGGKAEIFLLRERDRNLWGALVKGCSEKGKRLHIAEGIDAEIVEEGADGVRTVRFHGTKDIREVLAEVGRTPLPPYIKREPAREDAERYQTVYASREGAVAAPTAGLHFTPGLLRRLREKGVMFAYVTLHVGPGTFQPVRADAIADHRMLPERYSVPPDSADAVNRARSEGRRVIAVGTTSVRAIETASRDNGVVEAGEGNSDLFIYPGYRFNATDGIITNFHLPKSTLVMLVSAFAGRENVLSAYRTAAEKGYRFYSYGDAMMIL